MSSAGQEPETQSEDLPTAMREGDLRPRCVWRAEGAHWKVGLDMWLLITKACFSSICTRYSVITVTFVFIFVIVKGQLTGLFLFLFLFLPHSDLDEHATSSNYVM